MKSPAALAIEHTKDADALRLLIAGTIDYAIFMLDPTGRVVSWNAGARRMNGYDAEEIIGQHFSAFYPPEVLERKWPAHELELAERDGRFEDEGWRVRKDGTRFWANVVITALRDETGRLIGFGKVSRDLTERKRAEEELRESEERFRLIVESTLDYAIFMLDPQGHIVSWNAGAERIKGYKPHEIIGQHFSVFYPPDACERGWPAEELRRAIAAGRFEDEGWRIRKDGSRFYANVVITPLRGRDGQLRGFAKVTRDISDRKAHEGHIRKLTQELQRRVAELDTTNRELAHESLAFIRNAVKHLGSIVDGLLRLSRAGRIEYDFQPVEVASVVQDILASMHSTIVSSGARVRVDRLPAIRGDRTAVGQVFANIIGNALKSFDQQRAGVIEISASPDNPPVFSIRDNGVGIPVEYHSKLFQVFQHVHDDRTRGEGMGLAIVRRIVERHGGRIWFQSERGVGSTFFFTFGETMPSRSALPASED
jgi:PAS domain S-box-containing protein